MPFDDEPKLFLLPGLEGLVEGEDEPEEDDALGPPPEGLRSVVLEAILLSADRPLTTDELDQALGRPGELVVRELLEDARDRFAHRASGIHLVEVAKGWQLRTDVRAGAWVTAFKGGKPVRISKPALEALAVVAYRQPVTRAEVEDLRGVDCGGVMRVLSERNLIAVTGRKDEPGRPLLYCTTPQFLELFGLRDLSDLPTLRDLRELVRDDPREGGGTFEDEPAPPAP